jgi:hypothetical protein
VIAAIGNLFLVFFALDGALSLVDELQPLPAITFLRNGFAYTVLMLLVPVYALVALGPTLPARIFLPLVVTGVWLNFGAAPLVMWTGIDGLGLAASAIQLLAAIAGLAAVRHHTGGRWLLPTDATAPFSASRFVALVGGAVVVAPLALIVYSGVALGSYAHAATAGFLAFDLEGITLADRTYRHTDRQVRLVGMMHIGEGDRYADLFGSFAVPGTVVLEEGVTDETNLIQRKFSYENVAGKLGLDQQSRIADHFEEDAEWPHLQHADVDMADLSPETHAVLEKVGAIWEADDLLAMVEMFRSIEVTPEDLELVQRDILDVRNEHLLIEIDGAMADYAHVVVPWGALHMPWIEEQLTLRGFELESEKEHRLLAWRRVAEAALGAPEAPASEDE